MDREEFLRRRKDRACAVILKYVDREELDEKARARIRKVVLDQLNEFHAGALDLLRSLDSGTVVLNGLYLQRLDEIYEKVVLNGDA